MPSREAPRRNTRQQVAREAELQPSLGSGASVRGHRSSCRGDFRHPRIQSTFRGRCRPGAIRGAERAGEDSVMVRVFAG
jgi:hypothetical protein